MQKITPFLWFDNQAEEAVNFYTSVFKNSKIVSLARYGNQIPGMEGKVLTAVFLLEGVEFKAFDAGPVYQFNPAISMYVDCKDQQEVDYLWNKLTEGGKEVQCGWLTDKYGISWQIVPRILTELIQDKDKEKAGRVMQAMMKMVKIDIAKIQQAYDGE